MKLLRSGARRLSAASLSVLIAACLISPATVLATNGMNLEGYGPIAMGLGGASMAYDNGAAAMMNNPATLAFSPAGNRLDVALGYLGINVTALCNTGAVCAGQSSDSTSTSFYMPAMGWVAKQGKYSWGLGMFAQGGMGTQYEADSFLAAGSNELVRSEVSVGRVLLPIAYEVNPNFKLGGTVDFVWAGMDLKMALSGGQFGDMVAGLGGSQAFGTASGTMVNTLAGAFGSGMLSGMNWARFDFSDRNDFTGQAMGAGYAGKIGGVFKATNELTIGAAYHSKTSLGNLETDKAKLSMNVVGFATGFVPATISVTGKIEVKDFEWPQTAAVGAAYKATSKVTLMADYKWINWKDVMKDFKMTFTADAVQADPMAGAFGLGAQAVDATMYQNWKNQNVLMLGIGYQASDALALRWGLNLANDPVPEDFMNPLFPAIIKKHATLGAGYSFTRRSSADFSLSLAPEVKSTNAQGVTVHHSQTNGQIMYSYRF